MTQCSYCGRALEPEARFCPGCGTQVLAAEARGDALIGRTLKDKYRILAQIGAGSMGTVYEAEHIGLKKRVAVKVLHRELGLGEETLQRFQREGIAAGKFSHPNAIQVFDFDRSADGTIFLAMEFVEGEDLRAALRREGRLAVGEAIEVSRQILGALAEAHAHGIVHRDLKPENVMLVRAEGGALAVKVLDFGLSKLVDVPLDASTMRTIPGHVLGTPLYMAPEQSVGREVDHRSDLYAVGLIVYELVSGARPFQGGTFNELLIKQATEPAPALGDALDGRELPRGLEALVARALEKLASARFQSAGEMLAALDALDLGATETVRARPTRAAEPPAPAARRRPAVRVLVALALIAAGALIVRSLPLGGGAHVARASEKPADERSEAEGRYVAILERARGALSRGDPKAALDAANEALALAVRDSEAYLLRAHAYRARRDDDTALADYGEALRLDPTYAEAAASVGWIELERGRLDQARERFAQALQHDPGSALAIAGEAAVLAEEGDEATARAGFERAVALDASCAPAQFRLGLLRMASGEIEGAVDALIAAKRADPSSVPILVALGEAYIASARPADAETQLSLALELDEDDFDALCALATLYVELGRHANVLELVETPLQRHPDRTELALLAGLAHEARGERAQAIARLEEASVGGLDSPQLAGLLGALYLREGAAVPALEQFRAVVDLSPTDARAHLDLGLALLTLERPEEARAALDAALELDSALAPAHLARAVLFMDHLADPELAMQSLRTYLELGGEDPRAREWLSELGS